MAKINWIRPTGTKITTNDLDAQITYCESLGWKREEAAAPLKRKRRTKEEMANGSESGSSNKGDTPGDTG